MHTMYDQTQISQDSNSEESTIRQIKRPVTDMFKISCALLPFRKFYWGSEMDGWESYKLHIRLPMNY